MDHQSCPGYVTPPFGELVADYPGEDVCPAAGFPTEWKPIFHRGRLDRSARVLVLVLVMGQDRPTPRAHGGGAGRRGAWPG